MVKKIISLSVDKDVYEKFSSLCREKGLIISKQIEIYMKNESDRNTDRRIIVRV